MADKIYEVVHSLGLPARVKSGEKPKTEIRHRGAEVRASELGAGEAEKLLAAGIILDPEAPVTGATTDLAHDRLFAIAKAFGVVSVKGSEYTFGSIKAKGSTAFREAASLDALHAAIIGHVNGLEAELASIKAKSEAR